MIAPAVSVELNVETHPAYADTHGTPHQMAQRSLTIYVHGASARFEQTDYGHPGRFNPWEPRGIDPRLQARAGQLLAVCEALSPLLASG